MVTKPVDRGQLMLVGAIAVSVILLTLVVLFNGILFAETISSSHSKDAATRALVVEHELEEAAQGIVDRSYDPSNEDPVNTSLEAHANLYSQTVLNSRPTYVAVDHDWGSTPATVNYTYHTQELSTTIEVEVTKP